MIHVSQGKATTIRRRLMRRKFLSSITGWLGLFAGAVMVAIGEEVPNPMWLYMGWASVAIGVIAVTFSLARVRCPRCNGNIGHLGTAALTGRWPWVKPIAFCPYCKVDLDESFDA